MREKKREKKGLSNLEKAAIATGTLATIGTGVGLGLHYHRKGKPQKQPSKSQLPPPPPVPEPSGLSYEQIKKLRRFRVEHHTDGSVKLLEHVKESCAMEVLSYQTFSLVQVFNHTSIHEEAELKLFKGKEKKSTSFPKWASDAKKITEVSVHKSISQSLPAKKKPNDDIMDETRINRKIVVCPFTFCTGNIDPEIGEWHMVTLVFFPGKDGDIYCEITDYNDYDEPYTVNMCLALMNYFRNVRFFFSQAAPLHCMKEDLVKIGVNVAAGQGFCFTSCMFIFWCFHKACCSLAKRCADLHPEDTVDFVNAQVTKNVLTWFKHFLEERVRLAEESDRKRYPRSA